MKAFYLKKRRKILKKALLGAALFFCGGVFLAAVSAASRVFAGAAWLRDPLLPVLGMTVISVAAYKPLDKLVNQLLRNYVYKSKSYAHLSLMNLAEDLALVLDLQEFANLVVNTFAEVLHLKTAVLLVPNRVRGDYEVASAFGMPISEARRLRLAADSALVKLLAGGGPHVWVRDRAVRASADWKQAGALSADFDSVASAWIIPLFAKDELAGALGFSAPSPEAVFDETDFQFFREFGAAIAKSLRNALSVAELESANQELQDMQSQLLQSTKLAAIEQLATGLAHEIHNPLTIISGKAQVLLLRKDRNQLDEHVEEVLKTIVKQTKRAADITRKLLMFSQGSGSPKEWLRLEQVLEDTLSLVSYQTSLEGIEIARALGPVPPVYANVHELREVFLNLILNAVESIGTKGRISFELVSRPSEQVIEIRIADTGRGIPREHIDKLFNPFFTTRQDAAGLGLFVTKQIIHRYGGSIRVESRPGEGSLFMIQWPYLEPAGPLAEREAGGTLFPAGETRGSKGDS